MSGFRQVFRLMSPAGGRGRLSILIFHRVVKSADPLFPELPDAAKFETILRWLKTWFNVLPLDQALSRLTDGSVPERAAAITFDDGYADNHDVALPLLRRYGLCATFFIATGFLDGGRMWNDTIIAAVRSCSQPALDLDAIGLGVHPVLTIGDRQRTIETLIGLLKYRPIDERLELAGRIASIARAELPGDLMMTSSQLIALRRAGMQVGAHTVTHPILAKLSDRDARREIADSGKALESLLNERVGLFAYPNGRPGADYLPRHAAMVRELGFDAGLTTAPGVASMRSDMMELPRFTPWDRGRLKFGARLAANLRRTSPLPA